MSARTMPEIIVNKFNLLDTTADIGSLASAPFWGVLDKGCTANVRQFFERACLKPAVNFCAAYCTAGGWVWETYPIS